MRAATLMLLLAACADRTAALPEPPKQHKASYFDIPVGTQLGLDILVVVDSSPAMAQHTGRVVPQLGKLFHELAQRGDPDWHLAVITSDLGGPGCSAVGDDGLFRHDGLVGAPFLIEWRHLDQRHTANYEGELVDAFSRLATVGTTGCARQQPLAAVRRALDSQPRNAGFRRDDASLLVVIVSASDDGSPEVITDHVEFLRGAAPTNRLIVAGIYDRPAPRLDAVAAAFQDRSFVSPLSADDVTERLHLSWFGGGHHWGVPCLEGRLGPVPECSISDVVVEDDAVLHESVIPQCDAAASVKPCWHIEVDAQNCPAWFDSESRVLEIERRDYPVMGTHVRGSCVTR